MQKARKALEMDENNEVAYNALGWVHTYFEYDWPAAEHAFDVLQRAAAALCRHLPEDERPPLKLVSLHIWSLSHGVATLFSKGGRAARKVPMTPEEILESGLLIYLKGLGVLPDAKEEVETS